MKKNFLNLINEFESITDEYVSSSTVVEPTKIEDVTPVIEPETTVTDIDNNQAVKDNAYYASMRDPKTGFSYNIPMLRFDDPDYIVKYINYMKMKETHPEQFERLMKWA